VEVQRQSVNTYSLTKKIDLVFRVVLRLPFYVFAIPATLIIRMIRPWVLVRIGDLIAQRIGHFSGNTELYCCERDAGINAPQKKYIDLFYFIGPSCNLQLEIMWRRVLNIWPASFLAPIRRINKYIPGWECHEIGTNTFEDRDVHNLQDRYSPHLKFTLEEESLGQAGLVDIGIPLGAKFICINVRDSAYLDAHQPIRVLANNPSVWSYHNYRDSDVQSYVLAVEELAERGYYVIRMGAKVKEKLLSTNPRVIDYACSGKRSDFMDIYLCAKCWFMISTGDGLVGVPRAFLRPVVSVNLMPVGYFLSYHSNLVGITKHHYSTRLSRNLSLSEIFKHGVGFSLFNAEFIANDVQIVDNTPEEIRDAVIEMVERLNGTWQIHGDDEELQNLFWKLFPISAVDAYCAKPLHGIHRARFGAVFLRNNRNWIR